MLFEIIDVKGGLRKQMGIKIDFHFFSSFFLPYCSHPLLFLGFPFIETRVKNLTQKMEDIPGIFT